MYLRNDVFMHLTAPFPSTRPCHSFRPLLSVFLLFSASLFLYPGLTISVVSCFSLHLNFPFFTIRDAHQGLTKTHNMLLLLREIQGAKNERSNLVPLTPIPPFLPPLTTLFCPPVLPRTPSYSFPTFLRSFSFSNSLSHILSFHSLLLPTSFLHHLPLHLH